MGCLKRAGSLMTGCTSDPVSLVDTDIDPSAGRLAGLAPRMSALAVPEVRVLLVSSRSSPSR
jgi:hypothetical protein